MELTSGTRLGPYEILGPLGAGGMGRVYRARDVKLDRPVAIKILRDDCAHDPNWLARFEREARLLAALSHGNIATVHGLDEMDGSRYLVMELVKGQTLAQRLTRGSLPVEEALAVCKQVAEALEAAHDKGIIHRDLKPANVMLTPEDKVKVLDFGLAKSTEPTADPNISTAPYEGQTAEGVIVGTAAYMAPEQARGKPLDRRCDIWAFGCILYESLTARQAFAGPTATDVLAAVLERTPRWERLPVSLPPRVGELLRRCLQKDCSKRMRDAGDVRLEIEEALVELARGPSAPPPVTARWRGWIWGTILAVAVALASFALGHWGFVATVGALVADPAAAEPPPAKCWSGQILLGGGTQAYLPRLSPDGQWLAFVVIHEQQAQVGVMRLDSGEWWVLTRNRDRGQVLCLCWSRDSTRLFFDRFFDAPVGVYSVSPLDRNPEGAREVLVVKEADSPQVAADGSLVVGKLDAEGNYRLNRRSPDGALRAVGPAIEFNRGWTSPVRALHTRNAVVFCGKVLDGGAPPQRRFYLLDLDRDEYRLLGDRHARLDFVPLAVSPRDDFACTVLQADDAFHVLRIHLAASGRAETLLTLTTRVWGLDVDEAARIYLDQVQRPLEVIRFAAVPEGQVPASRAAPLVERIASPLWQETGTIGQPLQLPDGRVVLPSKVGGRDRLLVVVPGKAPLPLLDDCREETAPPLALVGQRRLAFFAGSDKARQLQLAALEDDSVRREPVELGVPGQGVTALAASPDGRTLYYVQSRRVYEVPADGSGPPRKLEASDGVAVYPATGDLLIQRFEKAGPRLFRLPRPAGRLEEVPVKSGSLHLAPLPIDSGGINRDGRVLVASTAKDSCFWRPAILQPSGELQPIPATYDGDIYPAGWSKGDRALGMGYALRSELWRLIPSDSHKE
jgi:hypothetical protein